MIFHSLILSSDAAVAQSLAHAAAGLLLRSPRGGRAPAVWILSLRSPTGTAWTAPATVVCMLASQAST